MCSLFLKYQQMNRLLLPGYSPVYPLLPVRKSHLMDFPPVPLSSLLQGEDGTLFHVLLFLEVPEEAAGAQATITGRIENAKEPVETIQGERWADGVWAFWFPIDSALTTDGDLKYGTKDLEGLPYTLELYRTDGGPLAGQEGTLPENFQSGVIYDPGLYDVLNDILLNQ